MSYSTHKSNTLIYRAELSAILGRVRYPRHIHTGKDVAGDIGEMIVEDIVQHGQSMMSQVRNEDYGIGNENYGIVMKIRNED